MDETESTKSEFTPVREIVRAARSVRKMRLGVDPGASIVERHLNYVERTLLSEADMLQYELTKASGS
jgi:hypothetical protein